jgi:hypothetical protein
MNYRYLLVLLFLAPLSQVSAQKNKSKNNSSSTRTVDGDLITVEFDSKESDGDFKTITLGNEGAIVYYDKKDSKKGIEEYEFVKLDKELNEVYRKTYAMPKNSTIISSTENNGKVYLLIAKNTRKTSYSYVHFKEYILVKFDPVSQKFSSFDGALSKGGGYFQQLEVLNDAAYINVMKAPSMSEIQLMLCLNLATCFIPYITGLTKVKYKPEFIVHNMETKQQRNVPFGYEKRKGNTVVQSFSIDDSTMEATLLIGTTQKKVSSMAIRQVDANAKIGKEMLLKLPANKLLSDVRIASFEDKKILFGQYGQAPKTFTFGGNAEGAGISTQGISFGIIGKSGIEKLQTFPYTQIKNFKPPLSRNEQRAVKKGAKKGKDVSLNLRIHFIEPLQYNDEAILVGEVYYATYRVETYTTTDANGRTTTQTRTVFDGWAFSDILVLSFDIKGNLLWSNSVPYNRSKSFKIYDRVRATLLSDGAVELVYSNGATLFTTVVDGEKVVQGKKYSITGGTKKGDKVKRVGVDGNLAEVDYWFDNFYLATGAQDIKNKELKGKDKKRSIYYLKRIAVGEEE